MPSGKFDMYMRQVSRPRPRRVVPIGWPEGIRLRRAGLMYSLSSTREAEGTPREA